MKRNLFFSTVLIVLLALGFTGCDSSGDDGGGAGGNGFIGPQLSISGMPIYNISRDPNWDVPMGMGTVWGTPIWERFTGNATVVGGGVIEGEFISVGGMGSVTDGFLTFTIGSPTQTSSIQEWLLIMETMWDNVSSNPANSNARFAEIDYIFIDVEGHRTNLFKMFGSGTTDIISESILYFYVDRNVHITGQGRTIQFNGASVITTNIDHNFRAGWNAITFTIRTNLANQTQTVSLTLGDSGRMRWAMPFSP